MTSVSENKLILVTSDGGAGVADRHDVIEVTEQNFLLHMNEYRQAKAEIAELQQRMFRLDTEYHNKMESLRNMYVDERQKEQKIISFWVKGGQVNG